MATYTSDSGGGSVPVLAFLVGGLLVVVAVIAWFALSGGQMAAPSHNLNVNIKTPRIEAPTIQAPSIPAPSLPSVPAK